jgi:acyl carrier protein
MHRLWQISLDRDDIEIEDNFFDLNGHSLLAMQMITQLRRDLGVELEMTVVFEMPTIALIADHLDSLGVTPPDEVVAVESAPAADGDAPDGVVVDSPDRADVDGSGGADEGSPNGDGTDWSALVSEVASLSDEEVASALAALNDHGPNS